MKKFLLLTFASSILTLCQPAAAAGPWSWDSFKDFWINVPATNGAGQYPLTSWVANGGSTNANAWNYAGGNVTGGGIFPTNIGVYFGGGIRYGMTAGNTYSDGESYTFGTNGVGQTNFYIGYRMTVWPAVMVGYYNWVWDLTVPGWTGAEGTNSAGYLWVRGQNHGQPTTDNSAGLLEWVAPASGRYDFTATFAPGNLGGFNCAYAVVDSLGTNYVPRTVVAQASAPLTYFFNATVVAGQVVQFQVGAPNGESCPVGVAVQITNLFVSPTLAFASTTPAFVGNPVTFSVTASPPPESGTIQFYSNGSPLGSPVTVNTNTGLAQYTTSSLPVGTNLITASYSGAGRYHAVTNSVGVNQIIASVLNTTTTLNVPVPNPSDFGQAVTFTAKVFPPPSAGTVQFYDNGSPLGSPVAVNTNTGIAQLVTSALGIGSHPITANYSGAPGYNLSASSARIANVAIWDSWTDFWVDVPATAGAGQYPQTSWIADGGSTNANAWNYAAGNLTGGAFPIQVGTYLSDAAGFRYGLTAGNTYASPGQSFTFAAPGSYYIGYNMTVWPDIQVGKYNYVWDFTVPGWTGAAGTNTTYVWVRPQYHGVASADNSASMLEWTAPHTGKYNFTASFLPGNFAIIGGTTVSYAVVDSAGTLYWPRQEVAQGSAVVTTNFSATLTNGQVVQFQVGAPTLAASPVGVHVAVTLAVGTNVITGAFPGNPTAVVAQGVPGDKYVLQRTSILTPATWVNVATNQANGSGVVTSSDFFLDLGGNPPAKAFYRFKWQP